MPPKLDFLRLEKNPPRKKAKQVPTQCEQNQYGITMLAVMSIVGIVVYTSLGHRSNDTGRITLRSTQILKSHADSDTVPPITVFDNYEISPKYFEDLTSYECGDTTCQKTESCEQSISSSQYVLVSDGGYCNSIDGREPITTPGECATAGAALDGSVLPGENRIFVHDCQQNPSCVDITDYNQAGPCWMTGTSGSLKFNTNPQHRFSGEPCGYIEEGAAPSACVCKQTVDASSSQCEDAQCQQPDNMAEFFTQVLREHYGLNNVDNLHVSDDGEFSYEFKGATRRGLRSDMLHCDGQTKRLAVSRACQCENGLVSLGCNGESHGCEVCNSGFYKHADGTCSPAQCICTNGVAATDDNCPDDGAARCSECNFGYTLYNNTCEKNSCTCENGTPATGDYCDPTSKSHDGQDCISCNANRNLVRTDINGVYVCSCHPSDATVVVQYPCDTGLCVTKRRMDELNIGDMTETQEGIFEPIIAFSHRDGFTSSDYFQIVGSNRSTLHISKGHYMYVNNKLTLPEDVHVGDMLNTGETVETIRHVLKKGLFHPHTWSAKMLIDGVQTSTNTEFIEISIQDYIWTPSIYALYKLGIPLTPESRLFKGAAFAKTVSSWFDGLRRVVPQSIRFPLELFFAMTTLPLILGYIFPETIAIAGYVYYDWQKKKINP